MGVQGRDWGTLLAREINGRSLGADPESATPMSAGEAVGLDALQVAAAMTWLISERFVVPQSGEQDYDPYTHRAMMLTEDGLRYLVENPIT